MCIINGDTLHVIFTKFVITAILYLLKMFDVNSGIKSCVKRKYELYI